MSGGGDPVTDGTGPTFGLWYDFRQRPPLGDYARLHEEAPFEHFCFGGRLPGITHEQALESMRLFASEVAPRVRDAVKA